MFLSERSTKGPDWLLLQTTVKVLGVDLRGDASGPRINVGNGRQGLVLIITKFDFLGKALKQRRIESIESFAKKNSLRKYL